MGTGKKGNSTKPARQDITAEELNGIIEHAKDLGLSEGDHGKLKAAVDTLGFLTQELEGKNASIARLRKYLFGASTEKTSELLKGSTEEASADSDRLESAQDANADIMASMLKPKRKPKGHGRNGADSYTGAEKNTVAHDTLEAGSPCPECPKGKVYTIKQPAVIVRITGMAPLAATVHELARLRCNACGEVFTANAPPGIGQAKYDEGAASMIALLKYGAGMPFNRLEKMQKGFGIPLPSSTQWELVAEASEKMASAYMELVRQAAQGDVIYNDDTTIKILELTGKRRRDAIAAGDIDADQRVGLFTSGIVSEGNGHEIVLFFSGNQHAGENLADVLKHRERGLTAPIQMCDALSHNTCGEFDTILSNCLTHARRQFVEVLANFPDQCQFVVETLREVYRADAEAKELQLDDKARLELHQRESAPRMEHLSIWFGEQLSEHLVEPNSGLGKAIRFCRKHWEKLTLFLRIPGAPLDNNICERALKKAIIHRKNSYFYKTREGARVGDLFMSLIYTAERCGASPFAFLTALQQNREAVTASPGEWMPWNFEGTLARGAEEIAGEG